MKKTRVSIFYFYLVCFCHSHRARAAVAEGAPAWQVLQYDVNVNASGASGTERAIVAAPF